MQKLVTVFISCLLLSAANGQFVFNWQRCIGGDATTQLLGTLKTADGGSINYGFTYSKTSPDYGAPLFPDRTTPSTLTSYSGKTVISKVSSLGVLEWTKQYGSSAIGDDTCKLLLAPDGNLIVGLGTEGYYGNNYPSPLPWKRKDLWAMKINITNGSVIWICRLTSSTPASNGALEDLFADLKILNDTVYVAGTMTYATLPSYKGGNDMYVAKININTGALISENLWGGSFYDQAHEIYVQPDGSYFLTGKTNSNDNDISGLHGTAGGSDTDFVVIKVRPNNTKAWQKTIGGSGREYFNTIFIGDQAALTADNGIIVKMTTTSTDGDAVGNNGGADVLLAKLDANGTLLWSKCYGGSSGTDVIWRVKVINGQAYFLGYTSSTNGGNFTSASNGGQDGWLLKVNEATGAVMASLRYGSSGTDVLNDIIDYAGSGFFLAVGAIGGSNGTAAGIGTFRGAQDCWVLILDQNLGVFKQKCYGGLGTDTYIQAVENDDLTVTLAGITNKNGNDVSGFRSKDFINGLLGAPDTWVTKVSLPVLSLPITLLHFEAATRLDKKADLHWEISKNSQAKKFIIQQSAPHNPGSWSNVGTVNGKENVVSYQFTTPSLGYGKYYFRLIMEDHAGSLQYSAAKQVVVSNNQSQALLHQTGTNTVTIQGKNELQTGLFTIDMYDLLGRHLFSQFAVQANQPVHPNITLAPTTVLIVTATQKNTGKTITEKIIW